MLNPSPVLGNVHRHGLAGRLDAVVVIVIPTDNDPCPVQLVQNLGRLDVKAHDALLTSPAGKVADTNAGIVLLDPLIGLPHQHGIHLFCPLEGNLSGNPVALSVQVPRLHLRSLGVPGDVRVVVPNSAGQKSTT